MRRRVAIIGGGIFGVSAAAELAGDFEVTLFERRGGLLEEATYANQYRHHYYGYHYPRSDDTVEQCRVSRKDFDDMWGESVVQSPSYYCVAKEGSKTSVAEMLDFCRRHDLPYEVSNPPTGFISPESVAISLKTPEPVFDYALLKQMVFARLNDAGVNIELNSRVANGRLGAGGEKIFQIDRSGKLTEGAYDYAVNATYANLNVFCRWFNFPAREMELRLKELPVIRIPTEELLSVTVMDGPFVTMVPIGRSGLFTLGDVPRSVREVRFSSGGEPWTVRDMEKLSSRWQEMFKANKRFIPILEDAEYIKSMWSILPVKPRSDATDTRPTEIIEHGLGCWSVFSGKIISCATAAKELKRKILIK